jgi:hypothetical protein
MIPKDKSSLGKVYAQLQPLREVSKRERTMEELLARFEEKFDRLSGIIEHGLAVLSNSQNERLDRLAAIVENGFSTFNGRALKKLGKMNASVDSLVSVMKGQLSESKAGELNLQEREESIAEHEQELLVASESKGNYSSLANSIDFGTKEQKNPIN